MRYSFFPSLLLTIMLTSMSEMATAQTLSQPAPVAPGQQQPMGQQPMNSYRTPGQTQMTNPSNNSADDYYNSRTSRSEVDSYAEPNKERSSNPSNSDRNTVNSATGNSERYMQDDNKNSH